MSCLREIDVKYKGIEIDRDSNGEVTRIVYQSSRELCEQAMREDYFIGRVYDYGLLETMKLTQDEGPFWNLELVFKKSNDRQ